MSDFLTNNRIPVEVPSSSNLPSTSEGDQASSQKISVQQSRSPLPATEANSSSSSNSSGQQQPAASQADPMTVSSSSTTSSLSCASSVASIPPLLSYMAFKTVGRGSFGNVYLAKVVRKSPYLVNSISTSAHGARSRTQSHNQSLHGQSLHGQSAHSYSSANTSVSVQSVGNLNTPFKTTSGKADEEVADPLQPLQQLSLDQHPQQLAPIQEELEEEEEEEFVAIKKVYQNKKFKNRELEIMRQLHKQPHPYIVHMRHYFTTKGKRPDDIYLNLVLDYVPETLDTVIHLHKTRKERLPGLLVKVYMYQLLRGLAHLHGLNITHRDIKPHNLLVDPLRHSLKICDLGSAKGNIESEVNVAYICSRYYRAPELVLGCTQYTSAIDIWSAGCVLAEMLLGGPFFPGMNSAQQMMEIARTMGTPSRDELIAMSNPASHASKGQESSKQEEFFNHMKMPSVVFQGLDKVFPSANLGTISLLERLLKYSPKQRLKAIDACAHYNFDELRNPRTVLPVVRAEDYTPPAKEESPSSAKITRDMIAKATSISAALGPVPLPTEMFEFTEEELTLASPQALTILVGTNGSGSGGRAKVIPCRVKSHSKREKEREANVLSDMVSPAKPPAVSLSSVSKESSINSSRSVSTANTLSTSVTSTGGGFTSKSFEK